MKIHILGIAGTFMGGIAQLAKSMGVNVSGSDTAIYPPMSTQLEQAGIPVSTCEEAFLSQTPDVVVIGNTLSRGHAAVEATLNAQQVYTSGPQWLAENILKDRWVVAVAGTHGKTTTASMVAWILEHAGLQPGFLIGGVPENFGVSARLGASPFFVVEADEYDTAFFDKRSKFVHYHPRTCVLNNLEFDHADIFDDLAAIQRQFHHLVRTVPGNGLIIQPSDETNIDEVIQQGCWTPLEAQGSQSTQADWTYQLLSDDGTAYEVYYQGQFRGKVHWSMTGLHNVRNGLSAIAAAQHCGVPVEEAIQGLCTFEGVRRRMTQVGTVNDIVVYDDFAHHPTAIQMTLSGMKSQLKAQSTTGRLIAVFEPRSNTMRMGVHQNTLPAAFDEADAVYAFIDPDWNWTMPMDLFKVPVKVADNYDDLLDRLVEELLPEDTVVIMSNGSFGGIHQRLLTALQQKISV
ncbi:MAG: UDP-N-acetylmuramate:L-alanyl-gamma-D-glutamyl-meso-diaminopimelate ligase [Thiomicrospira sp.]|nr:MAG: UDP-N-acetylmuramate:L-alanyl-gamma-D-glutamyl-meso-diaminopimelate ligase [Thiomicrospira sp.]